MQWSKTSDGVLEAVSARYVWQVLPHEGTTPDSWVIRSRYTTEKLWQYFGAYKGLDNAKDWVARLDEKGWTHHDEREE